jgi:glycosyltransferase involved in cell wall biosynthesis
MNNPRITVLMTVYNGGVYLKSSVESILSQSFKDFEFVIVNDASKDDSLEVINSYKDSRIKVITNPKNLGQTVSLNIGLKESNGEYVARIDADDIAYPSWLEKQVDFINRHPDCAVASMRAVMINTDNQIIKELNSPVSPQEIILKSIFSSPINHVGCLMKRDVVLEAGGYDEQYKIVADYALWSTLLHRKRRILSNPIVLVAVRAHSQSISMLEADKRVIPEMVNVISQNVEFWSGITLTSQETMLFWRLIYAGHSLEQNEFIEALKILKNIYDQWRPETVGSRDIQNFYKEQVKTVYLKRIWGLIKQNRFSSVTESAMLYMKTYGGLNIFSVVWILSFLKLPLILSIKMYERLLATKAEQKVS